ncbi:hypothetical protein H0R92_08895 [Treponema sp. OMZ 840]|uniref:ABC transporter permease n=1 Tax=Treponema sp. OMZ 840 TaxID=244313 RepID=UPI003D8AC6D1
MDFIPESLVARVKNFVRRYAIACILCLCIVVFALADSSLISVRNIRNILSNAAPLLLSSAAMALCLFEGYIDLCAGSCAVFAAVIAGSFMQSADTAGRFFSALPPMPLFIALPAVLVLFFVIGMCNGFFIKRLFLPPWAATLGTGALLSALTRVYLYDTNSSLKVLEGFTRSYNLFGTGYIGASPVYSIPLPLIFSFAVFTALLVVLKIFLPDLDLPPLHKDRPLLWPAQPKSLTLKQTMLLYGIVSSLFALSGLMVSARSGSASAFSGTEFIMPALTVCVIASLSFFGGTGNWTALVVSVFIFSGFTYAADFIGVNRFLSSAFCALILLISTAADVRTRRKNAL